VTFNRASIFNTDKLQDLSCPLVFFALSWRMSGGYISRQPERAVMAVTEEGKGGFRAGVGN